MFHVPGQMTDCSSCKQVRAMVRRNIENGISFELFQKMDDETKYIIFLWALFLMKQYREAESEADFERELRQDQSDY